MTTSVSADGALDPSMVRSLLVTASPTHSRVTRVEQSLSVLDVLIVHLATVIM